MEVTWLEERRCGNCGEPVYVACLIEKEGPTMHYYAANTIEIYKCVKCGTKLVYEELA